MNPLRLYRYVGPPEIRDAARSQPAGTPLTNAVALRSWLAAHPEARTEGATYTVDVTGVLRIAPRHSEHVACAGGDLVLAVGEIVLSEDQVFFVSNQSTGYCPQPACWPAVVAGLARAGVEVPAAWSAALVFRLCTCGQINLVKDGWFVCEVCGAVLAQEWNFPTGQSSVYASAR